MNSRNDSPHAAPSRLGGLDGLRAVAVALVVVYHLFPGALPGGFLGVDIFFVISGFLITTLLLSEHRRNGRIALGSFWRRRARRLLPALALVLLISTTAAYLVSDTLLVSIGAQIAGASFFVANWAYIALGADYFAQSDPELFRNMWSLAIEEQFYLLLPLVLLFALRMRTRATRVLFFGLIGAASASWMSALFLQGASPTRVYFGTDTHVFGLLLGVALACALPANSRGTAEPLRTWQQLGLVVLGTLGLAALAFLTFTLREGSPESFNGGFQLATLAMLLVVWSVTRKGAWLGRALDVQPLRWVGERSYGIYLWHWPVLLLVTEALSGLRAEDAAGASVSVGSWAPGWASTWFSAGLSAEALEPWLIASLTVAITLTASALSYRYIEQPVRRSGLRWSIKQLVRPIRLPSRMRAVSVGVLAILVATLPLTGMAIMHAPAKSTAASVVNRGQTVLDAQGDPSVRPKAPNLAHGSGPFDGAASSGPDGANDAVGERSDGVGGALAENDADDSRGSLAPDAFSPEWAKPPHYEAPPPEPIEGREIFAVGDSVMLASAPELTAAFPSIWIDASVSRGLESGVGIVRDLSSRGELRSVLVVGLGTNGPIADSDLQALLRVADGRRIVLVNAYADRWWVPEVNEQLRAFADKHRGVTLADWAGAIPQVPGGLAGDDIHPNPSGGEAYAAVVQEALDRLLERNEQPKRLGASGSATTDRSTFDRGTSGSAGRGSVSRDSVSRGSQTN